MFNILFKSEQKHLFNLKNCFFKKPNKIKKFQPSYRLLPIPDQVIIRIMLNFVYLQISYSIIRSL